MSDLDPREVDQQDRDAAYAERQWLLYERELEDAYLRRRMLFLANGKDDVDGS